MFGSIFSALLIFGSPVQMLNEYFMKNNIVDEYLNEFHISLPTKGKKD
jgi:hypothetical protein